MVHPGHGSSKIPNVKVEGQTHDLLHSSQEHLTITTTKEVGGQHIFFMFLKFK